MNCLLLEIYLDRARRQLEKQMQLRAQGFRSTTPDEATGDQKHQRKRDAKAAAKRRLGSSQRTRGKACWPTSAQLKFTETMKHMQELTMEGLQQIM